MSSRTAVESKWNRSCNHGITAPVDIACGPRTFRSVGRTVVAGALRSNNETTRPLINGRPAQCRNIHSFDSFACLLPRPVIAAASMHVSSCCSRHHIRLPSNDCKMYRGWYTVSLTAKSRVVMRTNTAHAHVDSPGPSPVEIIS